MWGGLSTMRCARIGMLLYMGGVKPLTIKVKKQEFSC